SKLPGSPSARRKQEQPTAPYPVVNGPPDLPEARPDSPASQASQALPDSTPFGPSSVDTPHSPGAPQARCRPDPSQTSCSDQEAHRHNQDPSDLLTVSTVKQLSIEEIRGRFPITAAWLSGVLVNVVAHSLARGAKWEIGPLERATGPHVIWLRPDTARAEQVATWLVSVVTIEST